MTASSGRGMSGRTWWTAVIYVAAAAMFVRFYDLPLKPLHHDEGVNTLFLTALLRDHAYRYDPSNYHGPTLFYFGWLSALLLGPTTVAIRAVTAATGLAAVLLLLALRREIGNVGAIAAAALLAVSPGAVYFSRYFIHEMLLVCFTLAAVVAGVRWLRTARTLHLCAAATFAGLVFATKETALISAVVIAAAAAAAPIATAVRARPPEDAAAWRELRGRPLVMPLLAAAAVFVVIAVLFYSSFLTNGPGVIDAMKSFAIWTHTGTSAHTRPWHTYARWLAAEELPLLLLGAAGAAVALWKAENRFAVFAALWAAGIFVAYSAIPYKTPWLVLNVMATLAICAGYLADVAWQTRSRAPRAIAAAVAVAAIAASGYRMYLLNFVEYDDGKHPYVYVHTSREVFELLAAVDRLEARNPGATIAVTSRDYFPLPWYLRAYAVGYYGRPAATNDPIVIGSEEQQPALDAALGTGFSRVGSYRLRPGVQLVLYARNDLQRSATGRTPE